MHRAALLSLAFAVFASAGPLNPPTNRCAHSCPEISGLRKHTYEIGRRYVFKYETNSQTTMRGAAQDAAGTHLYAKIALEPQSNCEMALTILEVNLREYVGTGSSEQQLRTSPAEDRIRNALMSHDLHFTWSDGKIEELCANAGDSEWVLNMKRGMISTLQNTMPSLSTDSHSTNERDVSGNCPVTYSKVSKWNTIEITKTHTTESCTERQSARSALQATGYQAPSQLQSLPVTRGERKCTAELFRSSGVAKTIRCSEEIIFRPFSQEQAGAVTKIISELTFLEEDNIQQKLAHNHEIRRTALLYEHTREINSVSSDDTAAVRALQALCERAELGVAKQTPRLFAELVYNMRKIDLDTLRTLQRKVNANTVCQLNGIAAKRFFHDALSMLGNAHSMAILKDLVINKHISDADANTWLTSLAFQQHPAREMLTHLLPLIEQSQPRTQALLGVSALVSQYCQDRTNCHEEEEVKAIARALESLARKCDATNIAEKRLVIVALKAISNAGAMPQLAPVLLQCATGAQNAMEVKVAAVEAFRRMGCSANVDRSGLETMFANVELDSELRIATYLAMMVCPTSSTLKIVKNTLAAEKVNQVGSFVWTHLTNLAETSDPHKQSIRVLLEDAALKKQFNMNKLKYSRNVEKSVFFNSLNAGAKMESNLVWSQKSFLPRSATLNMTMDLFGKSFNFLELGGRVQGLESLLEKYLGPDSKSKSNEESNSKTGVDQLMQLDETFKKMEEEIGGALNIKIFGHQIAYMDLWKSELSQNGFNFLQFLQSLRDSHAFEWHKSFMFLDTEYTLPTISGLPLKLNLNGTASISLKMSGKLDMLKLMQWPSVFDVQTRLVPSAAVELSGMMSVEMPTTGRYGIKMVSIAHTSSELDGQISMSHDYKFKANLKMPSNKQELLGVSTQFFIVQQGVEREQQMMGAQVLRQSGSCTGNVVERVLGMQLCASLSYPVSTGLTGAPMALFAGPINANVNLFKRDIHAEYVFEGSFQNGGQEMRLLIDTPGSKVERRLLAEFKLDQEHRAIIMQMSTPWKKFSFNGALSNTDTLKRAQLKFYMDGSHLFNLLLENKLAVTEDTKMSTITPKIEIQIPGIQPITAKAIITRGNDAGTFEATFVNILRSPVKISANVKRMASFNRYQVDLNMASHLFNGHLGGNFQQMAGVTILRSSLNYQIMNGGKESVTFYHKTKNSGSGHMIRLNSHTRTTVSVFPKANADVNTELQMRTDMKYMKTKFSAEWGLGTREKATFESFYDYVTRDTKRTFLGTAKIVVPTLGLDHSIKVDSAFDHHVITATCSMSMRENKKIVFNAHFQRSLSGLLKLNGQISGRVQKHLIRWSGQVEQTSELRIYALKSELNYLGRQYAIAGNTEIGHYTHALNATFTSSGMEPSNFAIYLDTNPSQPKLKVAINALGNPYSVDLQYKLLNDDRTLLTFSGIVNCKENSVQITGLGQIEGDEQTAQLKVMWDAKRDPTRAVEIITSLTKPNSNGITEVITSLQINTPWRNIKSNFKMSHEFLRHNSAFDVEYSTGKKISVMAQYDINDGWTEKGLIGMIRVTTPFVRYETVELKVDAYGSLRTRKLTVDYNANGRRFKTDIDITLGNINNFVAKVVMITPWTHASYMQFHLKHLITSQEIDSILNAEFKTKKVSFVVKANDNGDGSRRDLAFNVELKSPFDRYKEISWTGTHKDDGVQYTTETTFKWSPIKEMTGSLNYNWHRNGLQVNSNGKALITTPFKNFESLSASWNHENTNSLFKTITKVTYDRERWFELAINGFNELTVQDSRNILGKIMFTTPSDKLSAELMQTISKQGFSTKVEFILPQEQRYITEMAASSRDSLMSFNTKLSIPQIEAIGAKAEINFDRVPYLASGTVFWSATQRITLQGKLAPTGDRRFFEISSSIDTPFKSMPHVSFIHRQVLQSSDAYRSYSEVEYFPGKKFTFMGELGLTNGIKLEGKFNTPFAAPREITVGMEHKVQEDWLSFSNKNWFNYNDEVVVNGELAIAGLRNIAADWKLITQQGTRSLRLTQTIDGQQVSHQLVVEYSAGQKIEFSSKLTRTDNNGFKVEFNQRTPVEWARSSDLIFSFTPGQNNLQFATEASFKHIFNEQLIDLEAFLQLDNVRKIKCTARLNTPWSSQMSLSLQHERSTSGEWVGQAELILPSGRIDLETGVSLHSMNSLSCRFSLRTPFSFLQQLTASLQHNGVASKFENSHKFKILSNGKKLVMSNKINLLGSRFLSIDSSLDSNIPGVEKINLKLTHKLGVNMYNGFLRTEYGSNIIEAKTQLSKSNGDIKMKLDLQTPCPYLKKIMFELGHSVTSATYFTNHVKINFINDMTQASIEESIQVRSLQFIKFNSKLRLPISGFEMMDINIENNNIRTTYKTNAVVLLGSAQYKLTSLMEFNNGLSAAVELTTPIEGYKNIMVQMQHIGSSLDFVNKLTILYPERDTKIENQLIWSMKDEKRVTWSFRSPFENAQRLTASALLEGTLRNFAASIEFSGSSDNLRKFAGTMSFNAENQVRINVKVQTPLQGFEMITLSLLHTGTFEQRVNSEFNLEMPIMSKKLSYNFMYNLDSEALSVNLEATAPKMGKMLTTMKIAKNQFQLSFELPQHLKSKWAITTNWRLSRPIQWSLSIETHIDGYNRMNFNLRETVGQIALNAHVPAWGKEFTCITSYKLAETNNHKVTFSMDGPFLSDAIQFNVEIKLNYPLISGKLLLTTPLSALNKLDYEFQLNCLGGVFFEYSDKAALSVLGNYESKTKFAFEDGSYTLLINVKVNTEEELNVAASASINNYNLKVESGSLLKKPIVVKVNVQRDLLSIYVYSQWQARPFDFKISLNGNIQSRFNTKLVMSACFTSQPIQIEFNKNGQDITAFEASLQASSQWQSTPFNIKITFENRSKLRIYTEMKSHFDSTPTTFLIEYKADLMSEDKFLNAKISFTAPFITKPITASSNFKLTSDEITLKAVVDSQWYELSNSMVNFKVQRVGRMNFQLTLELEHAALESPIELLFKLNIPSEEKLFCSIKTPFNNAWKNVEFSLRTNMGESVSVRSHFKYFPNQILDLNMLVNYVSNTNFNGKMTLKNTLQAFDMMLSHNGEWNNFENKISINQLFKYKGQFQIDSQSMRCNFLAQVHPSTDAPIKIEIVSDGQLTSESIQGNVRVDLPYIEKASLKFQHNGLSNFVNKLVIQSRFHTPIQYKGAFTMEERKLGGDFELTVPYLDTTKFSFSHQVGVKISQEVTLSTKFFSTMRYTANFNKHEGVFVLDAPSLYVPLSAEFQFTGFGESKNRILKVIVKQNEDELFAFDSKCSTVDSETLTSSVSLRGLSLGEHKITVKLNLGGNWKKISHSVKIESSSFASPLTYNGKFNYLQGGNVDADFMLVSQFANFEINRMIVKMVDRKLLQVTVQNNYIGENTVKIMMNGGVGSIDITMPKVSYFTNNRLTFDVSQYNYKIELNNAETGSYLFNGYVSLQDSSFDASFELTTPWSKARQNKMTCTTKYTFERKGQFAYNFQSKLLNNHFGEIELTASGKSDRTAGNSNDLIELRTPFENMRYTRYSTKLTFVKLTPNKAVYDCEKIFENTYLGESSIKSKSIVSFDSSSNFDVKVTYKVNTPRGNGVFDSKVIMSNGDYYHKFEITSDFISTPILSEVALSLKEVDRKIIFNLNGPFVGQNQVAIRMVNLQSINLVFSTSYFGYFGASALLDHNRFIASLNTPFTLARTNSLSVQWKPTIDIHLHLSAVGKIRFTGDYKMSRSLKMLNVRLDTPIRYLESTALHLIHRGDLKDFTTKTIFDSHVLGKSEFVAGFECEDWPRLAGGTFVLKTPFDYVNDVQLHLTHEIKNNIVMHLGELKIPTKGAFRLQSHFFTRSSELNVIITTPLTQLSEMRIVAKHLSNLADRKINEQVTISWNRNAKWDAILIGECPTSAEERSAKFLLTDGNVKYGFEVATSGLQTEKINHKIQLWTPKGDIIAQGVFVLKNGIHIRATLMTPWTPTFDTAFQSTGSLKNMKIELTSQWNTQRFSIGTTYDVTQGYHMKAHLDMPFNDLIGQKFSFDLTPDENGLLLVANVDCKLGKAKINILASNPTGNDIKLSVTYNNKVYIIELRNLQQNNIMTRAIRLISPSGKLVDVEHTLNRHSRGFDSRLQLNHALGQYLNNVKLHVNLDKHQQNGVVKVDLEFDSKETGLWSMQMIADTMQPNKLHGQFTLNTPIPNYQKLEGSFKMQTTSSLVSARVDFSTPTGVVHFYVNTNMYSKFEAGLKTPWSKANTEIRGERSVGQTESSVSVRLDNEYLGVYQFVANKIQTSHETETYVKINMPDSKAVEMRYKITGKLPGNAKIEGYLHLPNMNDVVGAFEINYVSIENVEGNLKLQLPGVGDVTGYLQIINYGLNIVVQLPQNGKYEVIMKMEPENKKISIELITPLPRWSYVKIVLDRYDISRTNGDVVFTITLPNSNVISGTLQYTKTPFISFNIRLRTPYSQLQNLLVNGEIKSAGGHLTVETAPGQAYKININHDVSANNLLGKLELTSPYRQMQLNLNHRNNGRQILIHHEVNLGEGNLFFVKGRLTPSTEGFQTKLNFATPFEGFRNGQIDLEQSHGQQSVQFKHSIVYDEGKKVSWSGNLAGHIKNFNGRFQLETPFDQLQTAVIDLQHEIQEQGIEFSHRLNYNNVHDTFLRGNVRRANNEISGQVDLSIPHPEYREINVNIQHTHHSNRNFQFKHTIKLNGEQHCRLVGAYQRQHGNLNANLQATTMFPFLRNGLLSLKHTSDTPANAIFEHRIVYNDQHPMSLSGMWNMQRGVFKAAARAEAGPHFTTLKLDHQHSNEARQANFHHRIESSNAYNFDLQGQWHLNSNKLSGDAQILHPFNIIGPIKLNILHNHENWQKFNCEHKFSYETGKQYHMKGNWEGANNEYRGIFLLNTPHVNIPQLSVELNHNHVSWNNFNFNHKLHHSGVARMLSGKWQLADNKGAGEIRYSTPSLQMTLNLNHEHHDWRNFRFQHSFYDNKENKLSAEGDFRLQNNHVIGFLQAGLLQKSARYVINHSQPNWREANFVHEIYVNGEKIIDGTGTWKLSQDQISANLLLKTTFEKVPLVHVELHHEHIDWRQFNFRHRLTYSDARVILLAGKFHQQGLLTKLDIRVNTPCQHFSSVHVNFKHQGSLQNFRHESTLVYGKGHKISLLGSLNTVEKLSARATLSLPFNALHTIDVELNHEGIINQFANSANIKINNVSFIHYSGKMEFTNLRIHNVNFALRSSCVIARHVGLRVVGDLQENQIKVEWNEGKFFQVISHRGAQSDFQVRSSFPVLRHAAISVTHRGSRRQFTTEIKANYLRYTTSCKLEFRAGAQHQIKMILKTPFHPIRQVDVKFGLKSGAMHHLSAETILELNGVHKYSSSFIFSMPNLRNIETSWSIFTPIVGFEKIRVHFNHNGNLEQFETKMSASLSKSTVGFGLGRDEMQNLYLVVQTPLTGFETIRLSIKRVTFEEKPGMELLLTLPSERKIKATWVGAVQFKGLRSAAQISFKLNTPFDELNNLYFHVNHQCGTTFTHKSIMIINNIRHVNLDFTYDKTNGAIELRKPRALTISYNLLRNPTLNSGHIKILSGSVTYLEVRFNNEDSSTELTTERKLSASIVTPYRIMSLEANSRRSPAKCQHEASLQLNADSKPSRVKLVIEDKSLADEKIKEMELIMSLPVREIKAVVRVQNDAFGAKSKLEILWDAARQPNKKITIEVFGKKIPGHLQVGATAMHPKFTRPLAASMTFNVNRENKIFESFIIIDVLPEPDNKIMSLLTVKPDGSNIKMEAILRQEGSRLNTGILTSYGYNSGVLQINFKGHYTTADARRLEMKSSLFVDSSARSCGFNYKIPTSELHITSNWTPQSANIEVKNGQNKKVKMSVEYLPMKPAFNMRVFYNPSQPTEFVQIDAGYKTDRHLELSVFRNINEIRYGDYQIDLELSSDRMLQSRLHWRPTAHLEIKEWSKLTFYQARAFASQQWSAFTTFLRAERHSKVQQFLRTLPRKEPLLAYLKQEFSAFNRDFSVIREEFNRMYTRNEFFLKDLHIVAQMTHNFASQIVHRVVNRVISITAYQLKMVYSVISNMASFTKHVVVSVMQIAYDACGIICDMVPDVYNEIRSYIVRKVDLYVQHINSIVLNKMERWIERLSPSLDLAYNAFQRAELYITYQIRNRLRNLLENSAITYVHRRVARSVDAVQSLPYATLFSHLHAGLHGKLLTLHKNIQKSIDVIANRAQNVVDSAKVELNSRLATLMENQHARLAGSLVSGAYEHAKWAIDHFELEDKLKNFAQTNYLQTVNYLQENSIDIAKNYLKLHKNKITLYEPDNGKIEGQIYTPLRWNNLKSKPTIDFGPLHQRAVELNHRVRQYVSQGRSRLLALKDSIEDSLPEFNTPKIRFRGYATIAGRHIMTFDQQHFDFQGTCNYLLARDFLGRKWAVSAQYQNDKKSITVHAYNKMITINVDNRVTVDGVFVELPFIHKNLTVVKYGESIKLKDTNLQIKLMTDQVNDIHTLSVSGWYHNRLGGLFGNFNNEPADDVAANDVSQFALNWLLPGECQHENLVNPDSSEPSETAKRLCGDIFTNLYSPMRRCFKSVDPAIYFKMCTTDVDSKETVQSQTRPCTSATLYSKACGREGVAVRPPIHCRRCATMDLQESETRRLEHPIPQAAEVVFVIEEKACIDRRIVERLPRLVQEMEQAFVARGISEDAIRFGLVGFGSTQHTTDRWAHSHTLQGQLFGKVRDMEHALKSIHLDTAGEKSGDALSAVRYALRYPFKSGATRHLVLLSCKSCQTSASTSMYDISNLLEISSVQLHVLGQHTLKVSGQKPEWSPRRIQAQFGFDSESSYNTEQMNGDAEILSAVSKPQSEICTYLALRSGGAFFDRQQLRINHVARQDLFLKSFALRTVEKSRFPRVEECRCVAGRRRCHLQCQSLETFPTVSIMSAKRKLVKREVHSEDFNMALQEYLRQ